jgi:hypothetical protein
LGAEVSLLRPKEPVLGYLRDGFNGLVIGKVILVVVIGTGVRVVREHCLDCLDCEDSGERTDENLSLIEGSGANGEGGDNNEVRICKGGVVVDPDGFSRVADAYGIFCQRQATEEVGRSTTVHGGALAMSRTDA